MPPSTFSEIMKNPQSLNLIRERADHVANFLPKVQSQMTDYAKHVLGDDILPSEVKVYPFRAEMNGEEIDPVLMVTVIGENEELLVGTKDGKGLTFISDDERKTITLWVRSDPFSINVIGE